MVKEVKASRDAERTRAELLAVATEVFAEAGYSGARVDEIAERTRTTKRMIYYYFGGKEGLYLAVLENAYRGIRDAEQKLRVDHTDPVEAIRRLAEVTFDHHIAHDAFIRLVSIENIHRGEFIRQLRELEADGLVHRQVYAEVPPRVEYSLTPLGRSLAPVLHALMRWGQDNAEEIGVTLP